jgi:hypothetical protein
MEYLQPCICKGDDYKPECPYSFEQGGGRFHCVSGDLKAIKISEDSDSSCSEWDERTATGIEGLVEALKVRSLVNQEREVKVEPRIFQNLQVGLQSHHMGQLNQQSAAYQSNSVQQPQAIRDAAEEFMQKNRVDLRKFDALRINEQSLNDYSIGGFKIDVAKTAEVVKKLAPLPPSALPKIFICDDLNFYHHFFLGIETLLGKTSFEEIIISKFHHDDAKGNIADAIAGFVSSGMLPTDNAVTMFVKKVLSSTFERTNIDEGKSEIVALKVLANLWGFRYIEPHMLLKDVEIKMWLSTCYNYYRTLWFDAFKSSGVPRFAVEGVVHDRSTGIIEWDKRDKTSELPVEEKLALTRSAYYNQMDECKEYGERYPVKGRKSDRPKRSRTQRSSTWFG